jgi:ribose-phosphate pyrophosphokinase
MVSMKIIAGSSNPSLAAQIAQKVGCAVEIANVQRFEDGELRVQISADLRDTHVVIVQSTHEPVNNNLMELLLLSDAARHAGCHSITALMPYFGYGRQDKPFCDDGHVSASLVAKLIEASGITKLITMDMHSEQLKGYFNIMVQHLSSAAIFAPMFEKDDELVVVAPDVGGAARANAFATLIDADLALMNKNRKNGVTTLISGDILNKSCVIIDDIVDSGETLTQAAMLLRESGARAITVCVTHGLFSGHCIAKIKKANFDKFYTTDTVKHVHLPACTEVLSTADLFASALIDAPILK